MNLLFVLIIQKLKDIPKISVKIKKLIKHNKLRYSLLSAINTKGIVCYKICYGSVNGNVYRQFIEDNKHLFINKIIFHDNVKFHHLKVLKEYTPVNFKNYYDYAYNIIQQYKVQPTSN